MPIDARSSFTAEDLKKCEEGCLFGEGTPRLPGAPIRMLNRIVDISSTGGEHDKGYAIAELDISKESWFFQTHFLTDPVMPGCLGLDGLWQLLGFHLGWLGHKGKGRAFGSGDLKFKNQVLPDASLLTFRIDVRKIVAKPMVLGVANGVMEIDGTLGTLVKDIRVGLLPIDQS